MINCILFNNGNFEQIKTKNIENNNIYKKCSFKSEKDFEKLYTWKYLDDYNIELWGKNKGNIIKNIPTIFSLNNISIFSKSIFIKKDSNNNFYSLNMDEFKNFFNTNTNTLEKSKVEKIELKESESENNKAENNKAENDEEQESETEDSELEDSEEESELEDSELSYEIYCYSDEC